jgi:hypothetical protein
MIIGRFNARFGFRIPDGDWLHPGAGKRARATPITHHNRAGETWPPNGVRRSTDGE